MENITTWHGMDHLTLRIVGSGAYVAEQIANLSHTWVEASFTNEEDLKQDN